MTITVEVAAAAACYDPVAVAVEGAWDAWAVEAWDDPQFAPEGEAPSWPVVPSVRLGELPVVPREEVRSRDVASVRCSNLAKADLGCTTEDPAAQLQQAEVLGYGMVVLTEALDCTTEARLAGLDGRKADQEEHLVDQAVAERRSHHQEDRLVVQEEPGGLGWKKRGVHCAVDPSAHRREGLMVAFFQFLLVAAFLRKVQEGAFLRQQGACREEPCLPVAYHQRHHRPKLAGS